MPPASIEAEALALLERGDVRAAMVALLAAYGGEVYGYLCSLCRDDDAAEDAFAQACESALRGLPSFRRDSSLRTWFYSVARHAALRELKQRKRQHGVRASQLDEALAAPLRSATADWLRTRVKDEVSALRDALSPRERELLVLRVDRGLSWEEIARICAEDDEAGDSSVVAARCRKQFERAKEKLKQLARSAGLI